MLFLSNLTPSSLGLIVPDIICRARGGRPVCCVMLAGPQNQCASAQSGVLGGKPLAFIHALAQWQTNEACELCTCCVLFGLCL